MQEKAPAKRGHHSFVFQIAAFFNTSLLINLTKELHQIAAVAGRELAIDFPLKASTSLTAAGVPF